MTQVAILIPAYNEEAVIARTLKPISGSGFELIVIANGCSDKTAEVARAAAPDATVLETPVGNKTLALNMGLDKTRADIVVALDGDTETTAQAVRALSETLAQSHAAMAYGLIHFDVDQSSWAVRAFYQAWQMNRYFDQGKVGAFFALKRSAILAEGGFAYVTNDDEWVRRTFTGRSILVPSAHYSVRAPRDLANLINVRRRVTRGNRALARDGLAGAQSGPTDLIFLAVRLGCRPWLWGGAAVYAYTIYATRMKKATKPERWERDLSNRQPTTVRSVS